MIVSSTSKPKASTSGRTPFPAQSSAQQFAALRLAASLGQIVGLMMRTPQHRHAFLADLEWLVVPAIVSNQFALHEELDPRTGVRLPVAALLWANVSEVVDARLTANPAVRPRLKPEEWVSGATPWLVDVVGDPQFVGPFVKSIVERRFKAAGLKTYSRGPDGRATVAVLRADGATIAQQAKG